MFLLRKTYQCHWHGVYQSQFGHPTVGHPMMSLDNGHPRGHNVYHIGYPRFSVEAPSL